jgi:hypothetical protein
MFPSPCGFEGSLGPSDELLYIMKTLHLFEELVAQEAKEQRIPQEILRVLQPCRGFILLAQDAFFVVLAFTSDGDPLAKKIECNDQRNQRFSIAEAQRLGIRWVFRDGSHGDPLTLRFPRECASGDYAGKEAILLPIVQKYLVFEIDWAKQRGLIHEPKPFFQGKYFKPELDLAFVLMPFAENFDDIYRDALKPTIESLFPRCMRADDVFHNKPIVEVIWQQINRAAVVVADLTGRNPNVFYEVGIAHTIGKEVVLLSQAMEDVPFDLRHLNVIQYKWTPPGATKMRAKLEATLKTILSERERYGR